MRKILHFVILSAALCAASGAAQAQIKCWTENGKRVCGDTPPPGAKTSTIRTDPAPTQPAAAAKDGADAKKGPLTAAEREAEYKKRQADEKKKAEKAAATEKEAANRAENCDRARAAVRQFESGQRISGVDAKGERYFLDESQIAAEAAKARQVAQDSCK